MTRFSNPLDSVRVASPCNADWDQMVGNDSARFCGQCSQNVYNLSSMTKAEAELLIGRTEGRLCVRYFCRADGSIMTRDCPVGLRAFRRRMSYVARAVSSAVLSFLAGVGFYELDKSRNIVQGGTMGMPPARSRVLPVLQESYVMPPPVNQTMGKIAYTPPKPTVRKPSRRTR